MRVGHFLTCEEFSPPETMAGRIGDGYITTGADLNDLTKMEALPWTTIR